MSIERKNVLGYVAYSVWDKDVELATFNSYLDAFHFIQFLESLETIEL